MDFQPGISVLCACKNRTKNLSIAIESWLKHPEINEIIIIDWSSDESLDTIAQRDLRIKIISVTDEPLWELSRAYNLAARFASKSKILKLDCDYILGDTFLINHPLENNTIFYSGDWRMARNDNEIHLSGLLYLHTENFLKIHGYNEIIQGWGYDDDDIYRRLAFSGLTRKYINNDDVHHIEHIRSKNSIQNIKRFFSLKKNMYISEVYDWNNKGVFSEYTLTVSERKNHISLYFKKSEKIRLKKLRLKLLLKIFGELGKSNFWKKLLTSKNKIHTFKKVISWIKKA